MRRRKFTQYLFGISLVASSGCVSTGGNPDDEDSSPEEDSPNQQEGKVIIEETISTKARYPKELNEGVILVIEVDVKRGGPLVVDVANRDEKESIFSEVVETEDTFEIPIDTGGTHYITFQGMDEAKVRVNVRE